MPGIAGQAGAPGGEDPLCGLADFFAVWDDLRVEPQEFREAEDRVAVILRMQGRLHQLELDEIWSGLYTLRDGRIVRVQAFATPNGALEAAGLSE